MTGHYHFHLRGRRFTIDVLDANGNVGTEIYQHDAPARACGEAAAYPAQRTSEATYGVKDEGVSTTTGRPSR